MQECRGRIGYRNRGFLGSGIFAHHHPLLEIPRHPVPGQVQRNLLPISYGAQHPDLEWLIGPDRVLGPTKWFIIIVDMFGNGLSSSPSNTLDYPPLVTIADNVRGQRRLLMEAFGITRLACVYGWSMGRPAGLSLGRAVSGAVEIEGVDVPPPAFAGAGCADHGGGREGAHNEA